MNKVYCNECEYLKLDMTNKFQCEHSDNFKPSWYSEKDKRKWIPELKNKYNDCQLFQKKRVEF